MSRSWWWACPDLMRLAVATAPVLAFAPGALATVAGGGMPRSDCYAVFEGVTAGNLKRPTRVECVDGDPCCDTDGACQGTCTFRLSVCVNQPGFPGCEPKTVTGFAFPREARELLTPAIGTAGSVCGEDNVTPVEANQAKKAGERLRLVTTVDGRPRKDRDRLKLACRPRDGPCPEAPCATSRCPAQTVCPSNPAGGPDEVVFTVLGAGTDLDVGWTGVSHNFPVIKDAALHLCLADCNGLDDVECTATGSTGPGTMNDVTFGPPLPLIAGGVAVCVTNAFSGAVAGTANLATGEIESTVNLISEVFITDAVRVCPRCETRICDGGPNRSRPCTVDGSVTVQNSLAANKIFHLSRDCPPGAPGSGIARLDIQLPITTGTTTTPGTGGSKPCREDEARGVPVLDDNCGSDASCLEHGCAEGTGACVTKVPSPVDPTLAVCVDVKGGISTHCCSNTPSTPCFDTRPGRPGIVRRGRPVPATPAFPDQTYPKRAEGHVMTATFCIPATGNASVDTVSGLPGPGAVTFNTVHCLLKSAGP